MVGTVRVTGLNEFRRAVRSAEGKAGTAELAADLARKVGEPVRDSAQQKIARYTAVGQARVYRRGFRVDVAQSHRRVTGRRGDFGSLQMRTGFIPALREHEAETAEVAEEWIRTVIATTGL